MCNCRFDSALAVRCLVVVLDLPAISRRPYSLGSRLAALALQQGSSYKLRKEAPYSLHLAQQAEGSMAGGRSSHSSRRARVLSGAAMKVLDKF